MKPVKVRYADKFNWHLTQPALATIKEILVLKNSLLVLYEMEVYTVLSHDPAGGHMTKHLVRLEYPKRLLSKFKRLLNVS